MSFKAVPCKASVGIVLSAILLPVVWNAKLLPIDDDLVIPSLFATIAGWSIWAGLSAGSFAGRLATLLLAHLCFLGTVSTIYGAEIPRTPYDVAAGFLFIGSSQSLFLFSALTFYGCAVVLDGNDAAMRRNNDLDRMPLQFSLRTVFLMTTVIAVLFAIRQCDDNSKSMVDFALMSDLQLDGAILALATLWLLFGRRFIVPRLVGCAIVVAASTIWILFSGLVSNVFIWPCVFVIALAVLLLPFRLIGYRIVHRRKHNPFPLGVETIGGVD